MTGLYSKKGAEVLNFDTFERTKFSLFLDYQNSFVSK